MLLDISMPVFSGMPIWPGDTPFSTEFTWQLENDCPVNVSRMTLSTHSGTHADAPLHYQSDGCAVDQLSLTPYLGVCRVVHCLDAGTHVSLAQVQNRLQTMNTPLPARLLIRTWHVNPIETWRSDFPGISVELINWLAEQGVCLLGVDSASLDPVASKTLDAHHALAHHGMAVLENLLLDHVPEGDYELIALPLKLLHLDASPVRAILRGL
ncbi:arylformamidase [Iodobacter arcticus]|uniref:Kynurenine formamidase n=1 Tax=Iodobacter arcticus TaxID=590593 RepID=A0ABW2QT70_9NEIS